MGGYGGRFAQWVMSDDPKPYNSFGNGSAMRVSPLGWWCTPRELFTEPKKCAECTHNHPDAIAGAEAVATAINECRELRFDSLRSGQPITEDDILWSGLHHAVSQYVEFPQHFYIDLEKCRNKFDETCQGTVPVALFIVLHSKSFEDAVRQAVCLGADADTLGVITGSIAEALFGIPEWMKQKAMTYLPQEMRDVVNEFHARLNRLRSLTKRCVYYKVGEFTYADDKVLPIYNLEKEWAQQTARSHHFTEDIKKKMAQCMPLNQWQDLADWYNLPLTLPGYIYTRTEGKGKFSENKQKALRAFIETYYSSVSNDEKKRLIEKAQFKSLMFWKLCLGDSNKALTGKDPLPSKDKTPSPDLIKELKDSQEPAEFSACKLGIPVDDADIAILRKGHLPEVMEDHWLMYTDEEYIRYYGSWSCQLAFEAHYHKAGDVYCIDHLRMSHALAQFGVNGDEAGAWLFRYLVTSEIGADSHTAWQLYLDAWEAQEKKYEHEREQKTTNYLGHIPTVEDITESGDFVFFWDHRAPLDKLTSACLSQWWSCTFFVGTERFNCAEQYMMAEKARLMGDEETRQKILATSAPNMIKALGRMVRNFDADKWNRHKYNVVLTGNLHKFRQNKDLQEFLLSTGDKTLAEASSYDTIWGIGYAEDAPEARHPQSWRGQNLLGFALMQVRDYIKHH